MSEKFKLAFGSDSEFFGHNANSQRLRVTKTPVDVSEDIYFYTLVIRNGRDGSGHRGAVSAWVCFGEWSGSREESGSGHRGAVSAWVCLGSGVEVERRVGLDTAERCRREFVGGIGEDKKKNGLHIERTDDNI